MRLDSVDAARGVSILQMIAYHFCYDLNYFSWIHVALTHDAGWIAWRTAIVTQFLFLAGVSLMLRPGAAVRAPAHGTDVASRRRFWRRWAQIAGCAALVSIASHELFGPRFIWFGVLHFVAAALILLSPLAHRPAWALALAGALVLAAGLALHVAPMDTNALSWIGFAAHKPQTEDFVPLFPWLGVVLLGMAAAGLWQRSSGRWALTLRRPLAGAWRLPRLLGRWPLTVYMLHQPLLFGALDLIALLRQGGV
jgi:uncharacterized membrane protein